MGDQVRILYVDDDPEFADAVVASLEREDDRFVVMTARSASEGLDGLAVNGVDCIVSEYDLPDRTGIEFLETVRERDPDLPFVLVTGAGNETVASEAISAGVTDYLIKSRGTDQFERLASRVSTAIERYREKRVERRLRELARFREEIIESANVWINVLDTDGNVVLWNEAAEQLSGYTADEVVGHDAIWEWLYPDAEYRADIVDHAGDILQGEKAVQEFETTITTRSGDERTVSWYSRAIVSGEEGDLGSVAIARDVTDRNRRIREIEEKTAALERQNERLEAFAKIVSHDLRNPLNVAIGRLDLAREQRDSKHLEVVANAHERMTQLIEDLLTLATADDDVCERRSVSLENLVEACWEGVDSRDASLRVELEGTITANESRLRQLFENLFRNAVEHGRDDVTIIVGDLDDGFYVEDDGPGIPAAERERIFESGYTTAGNGSGLGLAIVENAVEAHGWTIDATEGDAGGARFEIRGVDSKETNRP
ncbi:hybrid sensor histidine kinase/response regulator [Natrarchaeobius chitinivorans]|uniref:histidine kinase n=1 Tax=Natrarchaeobius chitinivorans TaxID=1679083 RepID=A0A3N6LUD6_NATCH|nr:ATP-binding protein [Natrarchaeobius chitinivorans]RQG92247.1 PAS domain S-box protein [Natrarchaeobius chitinivorans]